METRSDLIPIGAFAARTQLSIKALRLYDKLELLTPAHTDPDSGYRYYSPDQVPGPGRPKETQGRTQALRRNV